MRLKYLEIENYKNLKEFHVDFEKGDGLTILMGTNGSGKSNIIEAISSIFTDAYNLKSSKSCICDFNYELSYIKDDNEVVLSRNNGSRKYSVNKKRIRIELIVQHLPSNVISVYSGEGDRLWEPFFKKFYTTYSQKDNSTRLDYSMKMMYLNKYYWDISFLVLLTSSNENLEAFIKDELHIAKVNEIKFHFNTKHLQELPEDVLSSFIQRFNPDQLPVVKLTLLEFRKMLFFDVFYNADGTPELNPNGTIRTVESGITDKEIFWTMIKACMPAKNKIINEINIYFNEELTMEMLSEGEKKHILIKSIMEFLTDENTLLLLDEPDAHVHESKKQDIINLFYEYTQYQRQIVITSHSPTIMHVAKSNSIRLIENIENRCQIITNDKIDKISALTGGMWDGEMQNIIFGSNPIIVFEGHTDILYTRKAIEFLQSEHPNYNDIKVSFLSAGGTGNLKEFVKNLIDIVSQNTKIIVFCDNDEAGKKAKKVIVEMSNTNVKCELIPYKSGVTDGEFLIEDYFDWECCIKPIIDKIVENAKHPVKNIPSISKQIKEALKNKYYEYDIKAYDGFTVLIDKIIELI